MRLQASRAATAALVAALGWAAAGPALAQIAPLPSREQLDPAQRSGPPEPGTPRAELMVAPAEPCPFVESKLSFPLSAVEFQGNASLSADELAPTWSAKAGQTVSIAEVCAIRDRAAETYLKHGVLARVVIPQQEIAGGRVVLEVIEAHVEQVRILGDAGPAGKKAAQYLKKLEGLAPFDMNAAQRWLLLAGDVPGVRLSTTVRPGASGARGAVDLDVTLTRAEPVSVTANLQNFGSDTVGPWTVLGRVDVDGLTPLGERTSLVLYGTTDLTEQRVVQLVEEARLGGSGLVGRMSLAYSESRPGDVLSPLDLRSKSFVGTAEAVYPLARHRRHSAWLSGGLNWVEQQTDLSDLLTLTDDDLRIAFARLQGEGTTEVASWPTALSGGVELRKGLSGFGANEAGDLGMSRADGDPQAWLVRADGRAELAVAQRFSLSAAGMAQWADSPLLAYEEMSVGNLTIGRGYDPAALSGDRGAAAAFEARFGPFEAAGMRTSLYAFYDHAWVEDLDAGGFGSRDVGSAGAGVRLRLNDKVAVDLAYAHPLDRIDASDPNSKPDPRVLLNLVARFN
ncbi:ShlB/FhaC/HecB family hemolysin secretion/activation protein [Caulobacter sp. 17J65-9]|uniref:ShlB/FhaC/HecB family hemolysin secretion/activation protein n=1 Tax=Caulobacter sp. 17J65-9 TaxID=2709382 RepID=UPI0013C8C6EF|nr:ShlB/FhaC/HecB family hemolysin secretion/activation protein [Caulobacter sp. 17J65-9]NEX92896.1 ShlB/FhaC/HecB family hemolysin secretion/activation protein [Caulobacter sp. 17J65-9]